jgi:16S rRNA (guanine527-N7)-methyltransferase
MNAKFYTYMELLKEWNTRINLTAITEDEEIKLKHFQDSLSILPYIEGGTLVDVGTGAGFPGLPIAIERPDVFVTLVDSLEKRVKFLQCVVDTLGLPNVKCVHARAEDFGRDPEYREQFDYAAARAVASMPVLLEYCLPLLKNGGRFLAMKGANASEEKFDKALDILGGRLIQKDTFTLEHSELQRCIFVVEKNRQIPSKYPRKAGLPTKKPLL